MTPKTQIKKKKKKIGKMDLIKLKIFVRQKMLPTKYRSESQDGRKSTGHISEKGLIFRIHKELPRLGNRKLKSLK